VGGLDPGGGAGVLADLRAFQRAGAFGCAAVALTTVQSTAGVRSVRAESARELTAQIVEVLAHQRVRAVKVGALGSRENVAAVSRQLASRRHIPVVVDTPISPTRGHVDLTERRALETVRARLLPLTTLLTVNLEEASLLLGAPVRTQGDAREAARALARFGARAVLVKGGHLKGPSANDVMAIDGEILELRAPRLGVGPVHGTGCTFASLVAGRLASREGRAGRDALVSAARWAKRVHHAALSKAARVGQGMKVLLF
jgi:hydroxymethylpyrimidine/phosphomethylpyrimidine kinase